MSPGDRCPLNVDCRRRALRPPGNLPRAGRARPALPLAPPPLGLALSISLDAAPFNPTGFFMLHFYFHSIQCIF